MKSPDLAHLNGGSILAESEKLQVWVRRAREEALVLGRCRFACGSPHMMTFASPNKDTFFVTKTLCYQVPCPAWKCTAYLDRAPSIPLRSRSDSQIHSCKVEYQNMKSVLMHSRTGQLRHTLTCHPCRRVGFQSGPCEGNQKRYQ